MRSQPFLCFISIVLLTSIDMAQEVVMQFDASLGVNYVVTNPLGQKTGVDPRNASEDYWKWLREIPLGSSSDPPRD